MSDSNNLQNSEEENKKPSTEINKTSSTMNTSTNTSLSEDKLPEDDTVLDEINNSNAEISENEVTKKAIEFKDYSNMSLEYLALELEKLVKEEDILSIKKHVDAINTEFKTRFKNLVEEKKEAFINEGGNEIDFHFNSPIQKQFKTAYKAYRTKLNEHFKIQENKLKENLAKKLEIIEELKNIINVEENINTTYKHFKELQERWRNTGPVPRDKYNNAWNSYHHQVEMFYDYLHLNRDLRDLDFKHNLEKKLLIIKRAEELVESKDILNAFSELQELHKLWKEELGPVAKEHREKIWEQFKAATKKINEKRQIHFQELEKNYKKNLEIKLDIIDKIKAIVTQEIKSHSEWQNKMKTIEELRKEFFNAGKVPLKDNEPTWKKFKEAVRDFNRQKNTFYKNQKKQQQENLKAKLELIKIAEDNKDSTDFETTTPLMKKIQSDWKKIGTIPRKDSDKIWEQFKNACNYYFDRINAAKNEENKKFNESFKNKKELLNSLKGFKPSKDKEADINKIKELTKQWKALGTVPKDKRFIEGQFQKAIDNIFSKLNLEKSEAEIIKFENKLDVLGSNEDSKVIDNERSFIRKKIEEIKSEIIQFENNLQFFKHVKDDNPLVKDVHKNIASKKKELSIWKEKLKKINKL